MKKETWMPHAGHFILGQMCRFRLNTHVNGYIISTVGEYVPDSAVRKIFRESRGWHTNKRGDAEEFDFIKRTQEGTMDGYGEEIGYGRKYETMVFKAIKNTKNKCCPYSMIGSELDFAGYNKSADAFKGHMKLLKKYSLK